MLFKDDIRYAERVPGVTRKKVTFTMRPGLRDELTKLARENGTTASAVLERLITDATEGRDQAA